MGKRSWSLDTQTSINVACVPDILSNVAKRNPIFLEGIDEDGARVRTDESGFKDGLPLFCLRKQLATSNKIHRARSACYFSQIFPMLSFATSLFVVYLHT